MREITWLLLAIIISASVPAFYSVLTTELIAGDGPEWPLFWIFYFFAFGTIVLIGLPAFFLGLRWGMARWWSAILFGVLAGIMWTPNVAYRSIEEMLIFPFLGAATGAVFWVFARQVRWLH